MHDAEHIFLQIVEVEALWLVVPRFVFVVAGDKQVEAEVLGVRVERFLFGSLVFSGEEVCVSELEEFHVETLEALVACDALETAEHQSLAHHIEVAAQRVHNLHILRFVEAVEFSCIGRFRERVVHDLVETVGSQHDRDFLLNLLLVRLDVDVKAGVDLGRDGDVVVAVDTEDLLDEVGWTIHIDFASRHVDCDISVGELNNLAVKVFEDVDSHVFLDFLTCNLVKIIELQLYADRCEVAVHHVFHF